jgi:hypothetical protein
MVSDTLERIIKDAMQIREQSYDHAAAEKADKESEDAEFIDFSSFYKKTVKEASDEAATAAGDPRLGEVVYYLLSYVWNDISDWAEGRT